MQMKPLPTKSPTPQKDSLKTHETSHCKNIPEWKHKQQLKKQKKQKYGQHYNYEYHKPIQNKMFWLQENRNTEIEKANRILLEKIQKIFRRSGCRKQEDSNMDIVIPSTHPPRSQSNYIASGKNNLTLEKGNIGGQQHSIDYRTNRHYTGERRNSHSNMAGNLWTLNKGIEQAKFDMLMQEKQFSAQKINEGELNRNLVKLQTIIAAQIKRDRQQPHYNTLSRNDDNCPPNWTKGNIKRNQVRKKERSLNRQQHISSNQFNIQIQPFDKNKNKQQQIAQNDYPKPSNNFYNKVRNQESNNPQNGHHYDKNSQEKQQIMNEQEGLISQTKKQ